jgi:RNase P subunit RPR2
MLNRTSAVRALLRRVARSVHPLPARRARLIHCRHCRSDLVSAVRWRHLADGGWWVRVRCGECGSRADVTATTEEARRFQRDLVEGRRDIAAALTRLERDRMLADARTLSVALELDLVDAGDFRGHP